MSELGETADLGNRDGLPKRPLPWQSHVLVSLFDVEHDIACAEMRDEADSHKQTISDARRAIEDSKAKVTSRRSVLHPVRWFRGGHIDYAYRHLHCAEVITASLLPAEEIYARTPDLVIKYRKCLDNKNDERLRALESFAQPKETVSGGSELNAHSEGGSTVPPASDARPVDRSAYGNALRNTYDILDQRYAALRSLRNALLVGTLVLSIIVVILCAITWITPTAVPLCFRPSEPDWICASASGTGATVPGHGDVALIAFMGLLGAALSSAIALSRLPRSRESHALSFALALFKLPIGALTAIAGILLIHGRFIPGLSELDTQQQILAYAFAFGFAQILVTRLIDRQAGDLIGEIPEKEARPDAGTTTPVPVGGTGSVAGSSTADGSGEAVFVEEDG